LHIGLAQALDEVHRLAGKLGVQVGDFEANDRRRFQVG
jgi:hypothetical protein